MKVFVLGGSGTVGRAVVELLAADADVTRVTVAGRDPDRAAAVAAEFDAKAVAVRSDGTNEDELAAQLAGHDLILNAAWADSTVPAIRAAIRTGSDYCDVVSFQAADIEAASRLGPRAEAAGIAAVLANGAHPSVTNLLGLHAAGRLDEVEQLQLGDASMLDFATGRDLTPKQWREDPRESQSVLPPFLGIIELTLQMARDNGTRTLCDYRDGRWQEIDPVSSGVPVPLPEGGVAVRRPYVCLDPIFGSLPGAVGSTPPVEMNFSPLPPQLHDVLRQVATRVLHGDLGIDAAIESFTATIEADPDRWLTLPDDYVLIAKTWARAVGHKDGRPARSTCWLTAPAWDIGVYRLTSVALAAAAKLTWRGDVSRRGVMTAEQAFVPRTFLDECAAQLGDLLPGGEIIAESADYLPAQPEVVT